MTHLNSELVLELLHRLYGRILVPEAVVEELKAGADQGEDVPDIADYAWIEVRPVPVPEVVSWDFSDTYAPARAIAAAS